MMAMMHHRPQKPTKMFKAAIPGEIHTRKDEDMEDDEAYTGFRAKFYRKINQMHLDIAEANPAQFPNGQVYMEYRRSFMKSLLTRTRRDFNWKKRRSTLVGRKTLALWHPMKLYSTGNMIEEVVQIKWLKKLESGRFH